MCRERSWGSATIDPLSYGVDGLRSTLTGVAHFGAAADLMVLGILCAAFRVIGASLFSAHPDLTWQERRARKRIEKVLEAALTLIAERGIEGDSMEAIAGADRASAKRPFTSTGKTRMPC